MLHCVQSSNTYASIRHFFSVFIGNVDYIFMVTYKFALLCKISYKVTRLLQSVLLQCSRTFEAIRLLQSVLQYSQIYEAMRCLQSVLLQCNRIYEAIRLLQSVLLQWNHMKLWGGFKLFYCKLACTYGAWSSF